MEVRVGSVPVHCAEYGNGMPVLALHGAGVDHRELAGALEPVFNEMPHYRRLYPDLPGMGLTPAPVTIASNDDVLDLLLGFIDHLIGMNRSFSLATPTADTWPGP
jgi:pimeloyl-ACP methyl ester carboxylesterase